MHYICTQKYLKAPTFRYKKDSCTCKIHCFVTDCFSTNFRFSSFCLKCLYYFQVKIDYYLFWLALQFSFISNYCLSLFLLGQLSNLSLFQSQMGEKPKFNETQRICSIFVKSCVSLSNTYSAKITKECLISLINFPTNQQTHIEPNRVLGENCYIDFFLIQLENFLRKSHIELCSRRETLFNIH